MDVQTLKDMLKDVKAGAFAVRVHYTSDLEYSKKAIKSGLADQYPNAIKDSTRLGRVKVRFSNTKYQKDREAAGANITHQPPRGMKLPTDPDEQGLFWYSIKTNTPYLILQQAESMRNGVSTKYFIDGVEMSFAEIEELCNQGVFTKSVLSGNEVRPYSIINVDKITSVDIKTQP